MSQVSKAFIKSNKFTCDNDRFEALCCAVSKMDSDEVFSFFENHWVDVVNASSPQFRCDVFMLAFASVDCRRHSDLQAEVKMYDTNDRTSAYLRGYVAGLTTDFNGVCEPKKALDEARKAKNNYAIGQLAANEVRTDMVQKKRFSKPQIGTHHY